MEITEDEKMMFFILLLENYAGYKDEPAPKVLANWDKHHLIGYINDMYWQYHTERLENAFEDIDEKMASSMK